MLDEYLARLARCATGNQVNRLHITLEDQLAPAEVCALIDGARARGLSLPPAVIQWLDRLDALLRGGGRPVQGYLRRALVPGATVYVAPGDASVRAERTLVIAYTGVLNRLMMPISLFLQACPADRFEFVVLVDPTRTFYLSGVPGLGSDLPSSIARLGDLCAPSRFRRAVTFGTSAGGIAAIWTAVALGLDRAVSVGGVTPNEVARIHSTKGMSTEGFVDALQGAAQLPEVLLVFGDNMERDKEKAQAMAELVPATTIAVPGSSDHNVLHDAWKAGELDNLLNRLLGEGSASGFSQPACPA